MTMPGVDDSGVDDSGVDIQNMLGISHFGEKAFARHALHPRSVLYVAHKH